MCDGLRASRLTHGSRLERAALRLELLDPARVLRRGYALLVDRSDRVLTRAAQFQPGLQVTANLSDGQVDLTVPAVR